MFVTFHLFWLLICILFAFSLLAVVTFESFKIYLLRIKLNRLIADKAKLIEEIEHYETQAKKPLGTLFEQDTKPFILSFDHAGKILKASDSLLDKFGYTKRKLIGKNVIGTILPKPKSEADNIVYRLFKSPQLFIDAETETITSAGQKIWISWTNKIIYDAKGRAVAADAVGFDITKRKELEAELQYLSSTDPQTGVLNRPALLETGATELKRAKRYKRVLSVIVLQFQSQDSSISLSDTQLKEVAYLTRETMRSVDYLGRIGDAEFALILPETSKQNVPALIQRIMKHLSTYNKYNDNKVELFYASASLNKAADTIDGLLNQAWQQLNKKPLKGIE